MIKLVAFDLDGTVLNGNGVASPESLRAIRAMLARGVAISTMSGRNIAKSLAPFSGEPGLTDAVHCGGYNGALVVSPAVNGRRRVIFEQRMPEDVLPDVLTYIREHDHNFIYYSCEPHPALGVEERYVSDRRSESTDNIVRQVGAEFVFDPGLLDRILGKALQPPPKILILPGQDRRDAVFHDVSRRFNGRLYVARTDKDRVELMHPQINKWTALERIALSQGIDPAETLAIGDGDNDLPMILGAGVGVVMGNADPHVLEKVDGARVHLTGPLSEEGFAQAMQKFVLI